MIVVHSRLRFGGGDGDAGAPKPDHVRFACGDKLPALSVLTAQYRQKHREARLRRRLKRNKVRRCAGDRCVHTSHRGFRHGTCIHTNKHIRRSMGAKP